MKKVNPTIRSLILLLFVFVLSPACDENDDVVATVANETDLLGVWDITDSAVDLKVDGMPIAEYLKDKGIQDEVVVRMVKQAEEEYKCRFKGRMEFKENGVCLNSFNELTDTCSYQLLENGDKMLIRASTGEETVFTIDSFSKRNMTLSAFKTWNYYAETGIPELPAVGGNMDINMSIMLTKK